jgi:hypothetical protein
MPRIALALLVLTLFGCASTHDVRIKNRENLLRLAIGINKFEVLQTMGTETIGTVNNPYRVETPLDKDGRLLEVLFYHTDVRKKDKLISDDELTPIVLQDNKLIGWGWAFLSERVPSYHYKVDVK